MLVHTKKPPIEARHPAVKKRADNVRMSVLCPLKNAELIKQYLEKKGCVFVNEEQNLTDAKELFAERTSANMLIGARGKENITQVRLSKITGIPRRHISDMENGRRPIGKQNAIKLGQALNINYRLFL